MGLNWAKIKVSAGLTFLSEKFALGKNLYPCLFQLWQLSAFLGSQPPSNSKVSRGHLSSLNNASFLVLTLLLPFSPYKDCVIT